MREEQIEATLIGQEERATKVIEKMEKIRIRLIIDNSFENLNIQK